MNAENIQQERSYHGFIQDFSSLSKKIKEDENLPPLFDETKDESIYNTVVDFYAAKFLIAYGTSQEKDIDKVLKKELDKTKEAAQKLGDKAKQKLESEVQKRLKDYIEGGVKEDSVKIYGNHASIKLEDNKKEFKISEFLNSDFCQKNGISGFSTLHSDGTSGMHGFVAEEGKEKEKRKVRHYVVTDGSYEMTLNWYANGEKCTIKIKIDSEGVEFIDGNINYDEKEKLQANEDVKIGGLFLHQIQFREKGQEKEVQYGKGGNQAQHEAYETVIKSDIGKEVKKSAQKHQATHMNRGIGSQTPPLPPPRISSLNKDISDKKRDLDHQNDGQRNEQEKLTPKVQQQEKRGDLFQDIRNFKKNNLQHVDGRKTLIEKSDKNDSSIDIKTNDSGYSSPITDQSQFQVDPKSLTRKLEALNHKEEDKLSGEYGKNSKDHDTGKNIPKDPFLENILQKIKEDKPIYKWIKDKIEGKEDNQSLDMMEEKLSEKGNIPKDPFSENILEKIQEGKQYDPIRKLLKNKIEGKEDNHNLDALEKTLSQKNGNTVEENDSNRPISPVSVDENTNVEQSSDTQQESSHRSDVDNKLESAQPTNPADRVMDELREVLKKTDKGPTKPAQQVTEKNIPKDSFSENILQKIKEDKPIYKWLKDKIEGKEDNHNLDALEKTLSQKNGNTVEENDSNRPISPVSVDGNANVEQSKDIQSQKSSRSNGQEPEEEEKNFQKISEALVSWKEKRLNNYRKINEDIKEISFNAQEKAQSNHTNNLTPFENLLKEIREKSKQDNRGLKKVDFTNKPLQNKDESELQEKFSQEKRGLKPANQKEMSEQTREHLLKDGLLKDDSTDVKKVAERESAGTNQVIDKNSDLSKILEKDEEQLKVGVIEEEREDTLAEHINSHDRNRIALSNKNRLLWTKHIKQQQENKDKGISI